VKIVYCGISNTIENQSIGFQKQSIKITPRTKQWKQPIQSKEQSIEFFLSEIHQDALIKKNPETTNLKT